MKSVKPLGFLLGFACSFASLGADEYITKTDIPYYDEAMRSSDGYIKERCVLDVYYPKGKKGFSTIVWFHGGGLKNGNKSVLEGFKDQGLAVVAANYRLHPKVSAPTYIEDAAAAVAWTFGNIESFGGDASLIFVSGSSAGGYLTAMVGLDKRWLGAHDIDADRIAGLIPLAGQTITHSTVRAERGIAATVPVLDELAPVHHVRADAPPILLITGDREMEQRGRYEENAYLWRMLKVAEHPDVRLFELDGYGHAPKEPAAPLIIKEVKRITKERKR